MQTGSKLQVTVSVYNSAHVSTRDLTKAEAQAASVFQKVGIKVTWVAGLLARGIQDGLTRPEGNPAHIHLRIWTRSMALPKVIAIDTLGFCLSMETNQAVVLYDDVQNLAAGIRSTDIANLLGLAMAHEIGHLLLQSAAHSSAGIMQARWLPKDLRDGEEGLLAFTHEQGSVMRNEMRWRLDLQLARKQ